MKNKFIFLKREYCMLCCIVKINLFGIEKKTFNNIYKYYILKCNYDIFRYIFEIVMSF